MADTLKEYVIKIRADVDAAQKSIDSLKKKFDNIDIKNSINVDFGKQVDQINGSIGQIIQQLSNLNKSFNDVNIKGFSAEMKEAINGLKTSIEEIQKSSANIEKSFNFSDLTQKSGLTEFVETFKTQMTQLVDMYKESVGKLQEISQRGFSVPQSGVNGLVGHAVQRQVQKQTKQVEGAIKDTEQLAERMKRLDEVSKRAKAFYEKHGVSVVDMSKEYANPTTGLEFLLSDYLEAKDIVQELIKVLGEYGAVFKELNAAQEAYSDLAKGKVFLRGKTGGVASLRKFKTGINKKVKELAPEIEEESKKVERPSELEPQHMKVRFVVDYDVLEGDDKEANIAAINSIVEKIRTKVQQRVQDEIVKNPIRIPISFGSYDLIKQAEKEQKEVAGKVKELTDEDHAESLISNITVAIKADTEGLLDTINTKIDEINSSLTKTIDVKIRPVLMNEDEVKQAVEGAEESIDDISKRRGILSGFSINMENSGAMKTIADDQVIGLLGDIKSICSEISSKMDNLHITPPGGGGGGNVPPSSPAKTITPPLGGGGGGHIPPQTGGGQIGQQPQSQKPAQVKNMKVEGQNVQIGQTQSGPPKSNQSQQPPVQGVQTQQRQTQGNQTQGGQAQGMQTGNATKVEIKTKETKVEGQQQSAPKRRPSNLLTDLIPGRLLRKVSVIRSERQGQVDLAEQIKAKRYGKDLNLAAMKAFQSDIKKGTPLSEIQKKNYYTQALAGDKEVALYGTPGQKLTDFQKAITDTATSAAETMEKAVNKIQQDMKNELTDTELVDSGIGDHKVTKWMKRIIDDDYYQEKQDLGGNRLPKTMKKTSDAQVEEYRAGLIRDEKKTIARWSDKKTELENALAPYLDARLELKAIEGIQERLNTAKSREEVESYFERMAEMHPDSDLHQKQWELLSSDQFEAYEDFDFDSYKTQVSKIMNDRADTLEQIKTSQENAHKNDIALYDRIDEAFRTSQHRIHELESASKEEVVKGQISKEHRERREQLAEYTGGMTDEYNNLLFGKKGVMAREISKKREEISKNAITTAFGDKALKPLPKDKVSRVDIKNPRARKFIDTLEANGFRVDEDTSTIYAANGTLPSTEYTRENLEQRLTDIGKSGQAALEAQEETTARLAENEAFFQEYVETYERIKAGTGTDADKEFVKKNKDLVAEYLAKTNTDADRIEAQIKNSELNELETQRGYLNESEKRVRTKNVAIMNDYKDLEVDDIYGYIKDAIEEIALSRQTEKNIVSQIIKAQTEMIKADATNIMNEKGFEKAVEERKKVVAEKNKIVGMMRVTDYTPSKDSLKPGQRKEKVRGFDPFSVDDATRKKFYELEAREKELNRSILGYEIANGKRSYYTGGEINLDKVKVVNLGLPGKLAHDYALTPKAQSVSTPFKNAQGSIVYGKDGEPLLEPAVGASTEGFTGYANTLREAVPYMKQELAKLPQTAEEVTAEAERRVRAHINELKEESRSLTMQINDAEDNNQKHLEEQKAKGASDIPITTEKDIKKLTARRDEVDQSIKDLEGGKGNRWSVIIDANEKELGELTQKSSELARDVLKKLNIPQERMQAILNAIDDYSSAKQTEQNAKDQLYAFANAKMKKGDASGKSSSRDAVKALFKEIFGDDTIPDEGLQSFYVDDKEYPTEEAVNEHYEELIDLAKIAVSKRKQAQERLRNIKFGSKRMGINEKGELAEKGILPALLRMMRNEYGENVADTDAGELYNELLAIQERQEYLRGDTRIARQELDKMEKAGGEYNNLFQTMVTTEKLKIEKQKEGLRNAISRAESDANDFDQMVANEPMFRARNEQAAKGDDVDKRGAINRVITDLVHGLDDMKDDPDRRIALGSEITDGYLGRINANVKLVHILDQRLIDIHNKIIDSVTTAARAYRGSASNIKEAQTALDDAKANVDAVQSKYDVNAEDVYGRDAKYVGQTKQLNNVDSEIEKIEAKQKSKRDKRTMGLISQIETTKNDIFEVIKNDTEQSLNALIESVKNGDTKENIKTLSRDFYTKYQKYLALGGEKTDFDNKDNYINGESPVSFSARKFGDERKPTFTAEDVYKESSIYNDLYNQLSKENAAIGSETTKLLNPLRSKRKELVGQIGETQNKVYKSVANDTYSLMMELQEAVENNEPKENIVQKASAFYKKYREYIALGGTDDKLYDLDMDTIGGLSPVDFALNQISDNAQVAYTNAQTNLATAQSDLQVAQQNLAVAREALNVATGRQNTASKDNVLAQSYLTTQSMRNKANGVSTNLSNSVRNAFAGLLKGGKGSVDQVINAIRSIVSFDANAATKKIINEEFAKVIGRRKNSNESITEQIKTLLDKKNGGTKLSEKEEKRLEELQRIAEGRGLILDKKGHVTGKKEPRKPITEEEIKKNAQEAARQQASDLIRYREGEGSKERAIADAAKATRVQEKVERKAQREAEKKAERLGDDYYFADMTKEQFVIAKRIQRLASKQSRGTKLSEQEQGMLATLYDKAGKLNLGITTRGFVQPLVSEEEYRAGGHHMPTLTRNEYLNSGLMTPWGRIPHYVTMTEEEKEQERIARQKWNTPWQEPEDVGYNVYDEFLANFKKMSKRAVGQAQAMGEAMTQADRDAAAAAEAAEKVRIAAQESAVKQKAADDKAAISLKGVTSREDYINRVREGLTRGYHIGGKDGQVFWSKKPEQLAEHGFKDFTKWLTLGGIGSEISEQRLGQMADWYLNPKATDEPEQSPSSEKVVTAQGEQEQANNALAESADKAKDAVKAQTKANSEQAEKVEAKVFPNRPNPKKNVDVATLGFDETKKELNNAINVTKRKNIGAETKALWESYVAELQARQKELLDRKYTYKGKDYVGLEPEKRKANRERMGASDDLHNILSIRGKESKRDDAEEITRVQEALKAYLNTGEKSILEALEASFHREGENLKLGRDLKPGIQAFIAKELGKPFVDPGSKQATLKSIQDTYTSSGKKGLHSALMSLTRSQLEQVALNAGYNEEKLGKLSKYDRKSKVADLIVNASEKKFGVIQVQAQQIEQALEEEAKSTGQADTSGLEQQKEKLNEVEDTVHRASDAVDNLFDSMIVFDTDVVGDTSDKNVKMPKGETPAKKEEPVTTTTTLPVYSEKGAVLGAGKRNNTPYTAEDFAANEGLAQKVLDTASRAAIYRGDYWEQSRANAQAYLDTLKEVKAEESKTDQSPISSTTPPPQLDTVTEKAKTEEAFEAEEKAPSSVDISGVEQVGEKAFEAKTAVIDLNNALESMKAILASSGKEGLAEALGNLSVYNLRGILSDKGNNLDASKAGRLSKNGLINRIVSGVESQVNAQPTTEGSSQSSDTSDLEAKAEAYKHVAENADQAADAEKKLQATQNEQPASDAKVDALKAVIEANKAAVQAGRDAINAQALQLKGKLRIDQVDGYLDTSRQAQAQLEQRKTELRSYFSSVKEMNEWIRTQGSEAMDVFGLAEESAPAQNVAALDQLAAKSQEEAAAKQNAAAAAEEHKAALEADTEAMRNAANIANTQGAQTGSQPKSSAVMNTGADVIDTGAAQTAADVQGEAEAMKNAGVAAGQSAEQKQAFALANGQVANSANTTASAVETEAQAFERILNILQNIANLSQGLKIDLSINGIEGVNEEFLGKFDSLKQAIDGIDPEKFNSIGVAFTGMRSAFNKFGEGGVSTFFSDLAQGVKDFTNVLNDTDISDNFTVIGQMVTRISNAGKALNDMVTLMKDTGKSADSILGNNTYVKDTALNNQIEEQLKEFKYLSDPQNAVKAVKIQTKVDEYNEAKANGRYASAIDPQQIVWLQDYKDRATLAAESTADLIAQLDQLSGDEGATGIKALSDALMQYVNNTMRATQAQQEYGETRNKYTDLIKQKETQLFGSISEEDQVRFKDQIAAMRQSFDGYVKDLNSGQKDVKQFNAEVANLQKNWRQVTAIGKGDIVGNFQGNVDQARDYISQMLNSRYKIVTEDVSGGRLNANNVASFSAQVVDAKNKVNDLKISWNKVTGDIAVSASKASSEFKGKFLSLFTDLQAKSRQLFLYWTATFLNPYRLVGTVKQVINIVKQYDDALTEMRKVSDESVESLRKFQIASFDMGGSLGTTGLQIQKSTADWLRLGETFEEAQKSAEVSTLLMNVSEFENIDSATQALVSASQAYKDLDKIEIVDKLNNIGNNFSISTDQLATGLQNAAAVLMTQGNDIDEAIALLTAGNAITQDISKTSAGIRTISLRISGTEEAKDEIRDMGEDVDDFVVRTRSKTDSIIRDYTAVASNQYKGISVLDANGNLRNTYDILLDIAKIYKEIQAEDKQRGTNRAQALVETLAGKTRSNIAASILQNPEMLEDVYEASQNSAGSAMEENIKYLDSISGKLQILTNNAQKLANLVIDSEGLKTILDIVNALVGAFAELTEHVGGFNMAIGAVAGIGLQMRGMGLFNYDKEKGFNAGMWSGLLSGNSPTVSFADELNNLISQATDVSDPEMLIKDLDPSVFNRLSKGLQDYLTKIKTGAEDTATFAMAQSQLPTLANQFSSAFGAATTIAGKFVSVLGNMLVATVVSAAISLLIQGIVYLINYEDNLIKKGEEAKESINKIFDSYKEQTSSFEDISVNLGVEIEEDQGIDDTISNIADKYTKLHSEVNGITNENISLTNEEYQQYLDTCNKLAEQYPSLVKGWDAQGNAILNIGSSADSAREALMGMYEAQQLSANAEIGKNLVDLYKSVDIKAGRLDEENAFLDEQNAAIKAEIDKNVFDLSNRELTISPSEEMNAALQSTINSIMGEGAYDTLAEGAFFNPGNNTVVYYLDQLKGITDEKVQQIYDALNNVNNSSPEQLKILENESAQRANELQKADLWASVQESLSQYLNTSKTFKGFNDQIQAAILGNLSDFDISNLGDYDTILSFVYGEILEPMDGLNEEVQAKLAEAFTLNTSSINRVDYFNQVRGIFEDVFGEDATKWMKEFGFADLFKEYADIENSIISELGGNSNLPDPVKDAISNLSVDQLKDAQRLLNERSYKSWEALWEDILKGPTAAPGVGTLSDILNDKAYSDAASTFSSNLSEVQTALEGISETGSIASDQLTKLFETGLEFESFDISGLTDTGTKALEEWIDTLYEMADAKDLSKEGMEQLEQYITGIVSSYGKLLNIDPQKYIAAAISGRLSLSGEGDMVEQTTNDIINGKVGFDGKPIEGLGERLQSENAEEILFLLNADGTLANGQIQQIVDQWDHYELIFDIFANDKEFKKRAAELARDAAKQGYYEAENSRKEAFGEVLSSDDYQSIIGRNNQQILTKRQSVESLKSIRDAFPDSDRDTEDYYKADEAYWSAATELTNLEVEGREILKAQQEAGANQLNKEVSDLQNIKTGLEAQVTEATNKGMDVDASVYRSLAEVNSQLASKQRDLYNFWLGLAQGTDNASWATEWAGNAQDALSEALGFDEESINYMVQPMQQAIDNLSERYQNLQNEQSAIQDNLELREKKGYKTTARDYKRLLKNAQDQKKNIEEQNALLRKQRKTIQDVGGDWSDVQDQIESNNDSIRALDSSIFDYQESVRAAALTEAQALAGAIQTAMQEMASETGLSTDTILQLKQAFSDLNSMDVSTLFYRSADGVKMSVNTLNTLIEAENNLKNTQLEEQIREKREEMEKEADTNGKLTSAYRQMEDELLNLMNIRSQYFATYQEQLAAIDGHSQIELAKSTKNPIDRYNQSREYLKEAYEMYEKGQIGSDDFKSIASYFDINGFSDEATFKENYDKYSKYFTEDASGLVTFWDNLVASGVAAKDELGNYIITMGDVEKAAEAANVPLAVFQDIIMATNDYGADVAFVTSVQDGREQLAGLNAELRDEQVKLEQLKASGAEQSVIDKQNEVIANVKNSIANVQSATDAAIQSEKRTFMEGAKNAKQLWEAYSGYRDDAIDADDIEARRFWEQMMRNLAEEYDLELKPGFEFDQEGYDHLMAEIERETNSTEGLKLQFNVSDDDVESVKEAFDDTFHHNRAAIEKATEGLRDYTAAELLAIKHNDGAWSEGEKEIEAFAETLGLPLEKINAIIIALEEMGILASDLGSEQAGGETQQPVHVNTGVDLRNRPQVNATAMRNAGYDVEEGSYATVFSSAYSNEDETKTVVVTPILPNGDILSREQLTKYADELLEGNQIDIPQVQLATFQGEDSVEQAQRYTDVLHGVQEAFYDNDIAFRALLTTINANQGSLDQIVFGDGDVPEGAEALEGALDGVLEQLGLGQEYGDALLQVLAQMGFIEMPEITAEVDTSDAETGVETLREKLANPIKAIVEVATENEPIQNIKDKIKEKFQTGIENMKLELQQKEAEKQYAPIIDATQEIPDAISDASDTITSAISDGASSVVSAINGGGNNGPGDNNGPGGTNGTTTYSSTTTGQSQHTGASSNASGTANNGKGSSNNNGKSSGGSSAGAPIQSRPIDYSVLPSQQVVDVSYVPNVQQVENTNEEIEEKPVEQEVELVNKGKGSPFVGDQTTTLTTETDTSGALSSLKEVASAAAGLGGKAIQFNGDSSKLVAEAGKGAAAINRIPNSHNTNITATDNASGTAQRIRDTIAGIKDKVVSIIAKVSGEAGVSSLVDKIAQVTGKTVSVTTNFFHNIIETVKKGGDAAGTAHSSGTTIGHGFANGTASDWTVGKDEDALTNEVGQESIVRDGKWMLLPGGPHIEKLKKDDIVFNAQQTEDLIETGKTARRGKIVGGAYANGTANGMSAYGPGTAGSWKLPTAVKQSTAASNQNYSTTNTNTNTGKGKGKSKKGKSGLDTFKEWLEKLFDWVEVRVERLEYTIDLYQAKAENNIGYIAKNKLIQDAFNTTNTLITDAQRGADKYLEQAELVRKKAVQLGVVSNDASKNLVKLIQSGEIQISEYDEKTREFINDYKEW